MKIKLQTLVRKSSNLHTRNSPKEDLECSITSLQNDIFEPYAQSTPFLTEKNDPEENKPESISCSKNPYIDTRHIPISQAIRKSESPTERKEETVSVKISNDKNGQLQPNSASHKNEQGNIPMEQEQKKALTDEEILRMERKRKQMEKQAEYKRLMKEREQQKSNETKKPNPKY
ncbi:PREDICTED: uncharacterized protein LOC107194529 [Dufourea novaeangliae]|nr:PREDICTED: uncharacterized protein LOC107194529 [Dufourea novaeangliae]